MTAMIGTSSENEALGRFLYDFRRALLRQRKTRLSILYQIAFPADDVAGLDDDATAEKLDFRIWLADEPPAGVGGNRLYRKLLDVQAQFIDGAAQAVAAARAGRLQAGLYARLLQAMLQFEVLADRVASGITTTMTDLDVLTGLLNRAAMERDLARVQRSAQASGRGFTLAMIDADHFKPVNDTHGHGFGDLVLETLAERFVASLRPRDQVYRYGGEEFLLLLPETTLATAMPVLERLRRQASAEPISDEGASVTVTVSLGATPVAPDDDLKSAIERADAALYRAKEGGRNRIEVIEPPA